MRNMLFWLLLFIPSQGGQVQSDQSVPREKYDSLAKAYKSAVDGALKARRQARTSEEKQKAMAKYPRIDDFGPRFLELAREYPADPVACEALLWIIDHGFNVAEEASIPVYVIMSETMDVLVRDHRENARVGYACRHLTRHPSSLRDKFLRDLFHMSTNHEVRGWACLSRARYLANKADLITWTIGIDEADRRKLERLYGEKYLRELQECDPLSLISEAEELFEMTIRNFGDLKTLSGKELLADRAKADLSKLRNQRNGKAAPEIEGEDEEGHRFRLSDYRGKVVVLSFSGNWCAPCRAMYPEERDLVARMEGKAFAMLSVNTDGERSVLKDLKKSGEITWRCWWDGGVDGPICKAWAIRSFPTIYVLDHRGIIRSRGVRGERLRTTVDMLLAETGNKSK